MCGLRYKKTVCFHRTRIWWQVFNRKWLCWWVLKSFSVSTRQNLSCCLPHIFASLRICILALVSSTSGVVVLLRPSNSVGLNDIVGFTTVVCSYTLYEFLNTLPISAYLCSVILHDEIKQRLFPFSEQTTVYQPATTGQYNFQQFFQII